MASADTSSDAYMLSTIWELWADQIWGGHLPLWFPEFAGGGHPVHAAWMYGLFYPPMLLFLVLPPETAWTWLSIAHLVFGAVGMFRFLRAEGRDETAAASGAVVFALSHFMVGRIVAGHLNLVMPFAWVPWTLLAARSVVHGERGSAGRLALCAAMGLLAGHVQVWFYAAPVIAVYAVIEARAAGRVRSAWAPLVTAATLTLGIAAIQWIPAWELFSVSGHPPEDARVVLECSAPATALVAQLAPRLWTSSDMLAHEFSGLGGPLAVAAVLFAFRLRDRRRWFWFGVLLLGLVLAMGLRNPVSGFANELPPFRFARAPGRAMSLVVLAGSVLAAYAVADIVPAAARWRVAVPGAFVASALAVGVPWIDVAKSDFYEFDWTKTLPASAEGHRVNIEGKRYPYVERQGVGTLRDVCPLDTPGYRALTIGHPAWTAWWFDVAAQISLPPWSGPPPDGAATSALAERGRVLAFEPMGLARMTARHPESMDDAEWVRAVSSGARIARIDRPDSVSDWTNSDETSSLYHTPYFALGDAVPGERVGPDEIVLTVDASMELQSFVMLSEKRYPGWQAEVDGEPAAVRSVNGAFLAVEVPGMAVREVRLRYRPSWLTTVLATSLASLAIAVLIVVRGLPPR